MTMDQFIAFIADRTSKQSAAASISKTIAMTVLSNLITLPFGFMSVRTSRSKTNKEISNECHHALYGLFRASVFDSNDMKMKKKKEKAFITLLNDELPEEGKAKILQLAIQRPQEYKAMVKKQIIEHRELIEQLVA